MNLYPVFNLLSVVIEADIYRLNEEKSKKDCATELSKPSLPRTRLNWESTSADWGRQSLSATRELSLQPGSKRVARDADLSPPWQSWSPRRVRWISFLPIIPNISLSVPLNKRWSI